MLEAVKGIWCSTKLKLAFTVHPKGLPLRSKHGQIINIKNTQPCGQSSPPCEKLRIPGKSLPSQTCTCQQRRLSTRRGGRCQKQLWTHICAHILVQMQHVALPTFRKIAAQYEIQKPCSQAPTCCLGQLSSLVGHVRRHLGRPVSGNE